MFSTIFNNPILIMPKNSLKNNNANRLLNSLKTQQTVLLTIGAIILLSVIVVGIVMLVNQKDTSKPTPKPTPAPKKDVQYVWWNPRSWYHRRHRDRDDKQTVIIKYQYPTQAPTQAPQQAPTQANKKKPNNENIK